MPVPATQTTVREGDLLWTPSPARIARANLTRFATWLRDERGHDFVNYDELWRWSAAANRHAMIDPAALDDFVAYARTRNSRNPERSWTPMSS